MNPLGRKGDMNDTIDKFGYPETLIHEYDHWVVLLRPEQVTIGSMIVANKSEAGALSQLEVTDFEELQSVTKDLENALANTFHHDKINYLLLMMVDKHVHFHVLPRYSEGREFAGGRFLDGSWPGPPTLASALDLTDEQRSALLLQLQGAWGR